MSKRSLSHLEEKILSAIVLLRVIEDADTKPQLINYILNQQQKYKALTGEYLVGDFQKEPSWRDYIPE